MKNRIKCIRKAHKMSQAVFARQLNVDQTAVSNWENQKNGIDPETAMNIAKIFSVPVEFVYGREFKTTKETSAWHYSHVEDMNRAGADARDFFLFKYGGGYFEYANEEKEKLAEDGELSEGEKKLIDAFRDVSEDLKEQALRVALASLQALQ